MAQQEIGDAGVLLPHQLPQAAYVPDHQLPAAPGGEIAELPVAGSAAVAQVVLAADQKAVGAEKAGRGVIAPDVLRHPVDNLHHAPGPALGHPLGGVDGMESVGGGIREFQKLHVPVTSSGMPPGGAGLCSSLPQKQEDSQGQRRYICSSRERITAAWRVPSRASSWYSSPRQGSLQPSAALRQSRSQRCSHTN